MVHAIQLNTEDTRPVLNMELLDQYRGRKNNLLARLIDAFLQEAPGLFQNIRRADETRDFSELRLNAHALKSCSANLGAIRLSKICQEIESSSLDQDQERLKGSMKAIGAEWFQAEQALKTELFKIRQTTIPAAQAAPAPKPASELDWY